MKIVLPVLLGAYICWYFWTSFDEEAKKAFVRVFKEANYFWIALALLVGFVSHISRAYRWRYAIKPLGFNPPIKNLYNATMIGYIANIIAPRMGEPTRAGVLKATDGIPFDKGFGTIVAERVIDVVCLMIVAGLALLFNLDKIDDLLEIGNTINAKTGATIKEGTPWWQYGIYSAIALASIGFILLLKFKSGFKTKLIDFLKGIWEGLISIFKMKDRWAYLGHTILIWSCYVTMFWLPFLALDFTATLSVDAVMAGFVAGTIGFIIVQGGLGTYPLMVGAVISFFRSREDLASSGADTSSEDIGFGALVWATQTVLIVVLGLLSLAMVQKAKKKIVKETSKQGV